MISDVVHLQLHAARHRDLLQEANHWRLVRAVRGDRQQTPPPSTGLLALLASAAARPDRLRSWTAAFMNAISSWSTQPGRDSPVHQILRRDWPAE